MQITPRNGEDQVAALQGVLTVIREAPDLTRPEIVRVTGIGRNIVASKVAQLMDLGLAADAKRTESTGGRAARAVRFAEDAGCILVAELGATTATIGLTDLRGTVIDHVSEAGDVAWGPERVLRRVAEVAEELVARNGAVVWGVGVAIPGPVEFSTGFPVAPPIMPGWDGFDIRGYFARRFAASVWVDNEVNVMALGQLRDGAAVGERNVIYVKVGTGIGAGLLSEGSLHRGDQGCAGDIGHINADRDSATLCRCGQTGCLEALAGGAALARQGSALAESGESQILAEVAKEGAGVTAKDVGNAAQRGDPRSIELITSSARLVGETLAGLVNFFNPSLVLLGGGVTEVGDLYLAGVRQAVLSRSLPLATRALRIERSSKERLAGLKGAAFMVIDELFAPEVFASWVGRGTPAGLPGLSGLEPSA